jgi:hypothetical protein
MNRHIRSHRPKSLEWWLLIRPSAATGEFWYRQKRMAMHRHPVRYFAQNTLPVWLSARKRIWIVEPIWWVRYRTIERNHIINTGLRPNYHDGDMLLLHANFSILKRHVELGLASKNNDFMVQHKKPLLMTYGRWLKSGVGRLSGLAYLDWLMSEDIAVTAPQHAETAKIIKRLYLWWVDERPQRIDPHSDPRIWKDVERPPNDFLRALGTPKPPAYRDALDQMSTMNTFYDDQDQAMLMKLVSIRTFLWA